MRAFATLPTNSPCCFGWRCIAEQFWSTEALGMGIFYTLNVFIMQFYLGKPGLSP